MALIPIEISLTDEQKAMLEARAAALGSTRAALARDLIVAGLTGSTAAPPLSDSMVHQAVSEALQPLALTLERVEYLAAAAVIAPVVATAPTLERTPEMQARAKTMTAASMYWVKGVKHALNQQLTSPADAAMSHQLLASTDSKD